MKRVRRENPIGNFWKHAGWFFKCLFGQGCVQDGSICWFSKVFWNKHDYFRSKGGDGCPSHFFTYECSNCKKKFTI